MQIELLKSIIAEQRNETDRKLREEIIERENIGGLERFLKYPNILAILGVRRCGKSVFSLLLSKKLKETFGCINFDDERLIRAKTEDLNKVLQAFYELYGDVDLILLDEIQNIEGWELFANRLRRTKKVIITGSNSKLLSGELATHLTGRHIDFTLYPFSFREILEFKPNIYLTEDVAKARKKLEEYILGSGFPEFLKFGPQIVMRIYEDMINKDCIRRNKIRNEASFREMAHYLVSNFSNEFTYSKLLKITSIKDVHTVKNYVECLKDAFAIIVLERFSPKLKQQIIAPKKIYAIDQGFCNFVGFRISKDAGRLIENIVCVELMRRKAEYTEIYYYKNPQGYEVDFVVKQGENINQLIQVCYSVDDLSTKNREIRALIHASEDLKCKNLLVITNDYEGTEETTWFGIKREIRFVPLWKWLLREMKEGENFT